jgi:hypothetical protein
MNPETDSFIMELYIIKTSSYRMIPTDIYSIFIACNQYVTVFSKKGVLCPPLKKSGKKENEQGNKQRHWKFINQKKKQYTITDLNTDIYVGSHTGTNISVEKPLKTL